MTTSLLSRIDKKKKSNGMFGKTTTGQVSSAQVYKDVNHALGTIFKLILPFIPGGEHVIKTAHARPRAHKARKRKGMLGRFGI